LDDFYIVYFDNILIYLTDPLEYELYIKKILKRLYTIGIQTDIKKNEFSIKRTKYLGFIISTNSIKINPDKIRIIMN
jgi:ribosome-interacting GTPase 1